MIVGSLGAIIFHTLEPAYVCLIIGIVGLIVVLSIEKREEAEKSNPDMFPSLRTFRHGGSNESLSKSEASKIARKGS